MKVVSVLVWLTMLVLPASDGLSQSFVVFDGQRFCTDRVGFQKNTLEPANIRNVANHIGGDSVKNVIIYGGAIENTESKHGGCGLLPLDHRLLIQDFFTHPSYNAGAVYVSRKYCFVSNVSGWVNLHSLIYPLGEVTPQIGCTEVQFPNVNHDAVSGTLTHILIDDLTLNIRAVFMNFEIGSNFWELHTLVLW